MKIAILTLPLHANYGGILQAYALQTVLERMGHQVEIFNKPLAKINIQIWKAPLFYCKLLIKKYLLKREYISIIGYKKNEARKNKIIRRHTQSFIDKNIKQRLIHSFNDIKNTDYDVIIVGSDQIWRKNYARSWGKDFMNMFLAFTDNWNIKRIAYAASFGKSDISEYSNSDINNCKKYLRKFDAISVREKSGVKICDKMFGAESICVLDPTMLLDATEYLKFINNINPTPKSILCSYILDQTADKAKIEQEIAQKNHLEIIETNNPYLKDESKSLRQRVQYPIESWLKSIANASVVVTDSFHACVFSILFHKQFYVIGNGARGITRIQSLLNTFNLCDRMISTYNETISLPEVDYSKVDMILQTARNDAFNFLKNNL